MTIQEYLDKTKVHAATLAKALGVPKSTLTYWVRTGKYRSKVKVQFDELTNYGTRIISDPDKPTESEYYTLGQIYGVFAKLMPDKMAQPNSMKAVFVNPMNALSRGTSYAQKCNIPPTEYDDKIHMLVSRLSLEHFAKTGAIPESMQKTWWMGVNAAKNDDLRPLEEHSEVQTNELDHLKIEALKIIGKL